MHVGRQSQENRYASNVVCRQFVASQIKVLEHTPSGKRKTKTMKSSSLYLTSVNTNHIKLLIVQEPAEMFSLFVG